MRIIGPISGLLMVLGTVHLAQSQSSPAPATPANEIAALPTLRPEDLDERLRVLSRAYTDAQITLLELKQRYPSAHPIFVQAKNREEELARLYASTLDQMRKVATTQPSIHPAVTQAAATTFQQERARQIAVAMTDAELLLAERINMYGPHHLSVIAAQRTLDELRALYKDAIDQATHP